MGTKVSKEIGRIIKDENDQNCAQCLTIIKIVNA